MSDIKYTFVIDGEEWKECHLERMAYERNLHILHQMKQHGIEIRVFNMNDTSNLTKILDGEKVGTTIKGE